MIGMADQPHDDDDLVAAAEAAIADHERIQAVLKAAIENAVSAVLVEDLGLPDDAQERFACAMWEGLEDGLDADDRLTAIAILIEDVAASRAAQARGAFYGRLASVPETPHPLASQEGNNA